MNLKRTRQEINKVQERIAVLEEKRRQLRERETELENTEIVYAVRALNLTPSALARFLERLKTGDMPMGDEQNPTEDR